MRAQGWEVVCTACGELRWPYLPERPDPYTCTRCRSGAGQAKRAAGKAGYATKMARRKHREAPEG